MFPFSLSHSMYVGTDRRIGDRFGRPIYLECKKTSQCLLVCDNCTSWSTLQREYLTSSRCIAYLLFASGPSTCAVCCEWRRTSSWEVSLRVGAGVTARTAGREDEWECSQQACTNELLCGCGHFPVCLSTSGSIPKRAIHSLTLHPFKDDIQTMSSSGPAQKKPTSVNNPGDLRVTVRKTPQSQPPRAPYSCMTLQPVELPEGRSDPSCAVPVITFGAPPDDQMSIAASEGERMSSRDEDSAALPPSGVAALPESDPEMAAMLSRAAVSVGLEWNPPPCPEPSWLDDWFLGAARAGSQLPAPVPFFPEVHEEVTKPWMAPFSTRSRSGPSSILTTLDGGVAKGYVELPPVEWSVAMQLCPKTANSWWGNPRLPSRACKFSSSLAGKAYTACGEATSALHAMALLQVHQAKALKELHEGSSDPGVMQELQAATDLALRATKVTARSLDRVMSTLVVQERHLWLNLADMRKPDKVRFFNAPVCQAGLFGDALLPQPSRRLQALHLLVAEGNPWRPPPPLLSLSSSLHLGGRLALPRPSRWLIRTIRLSYVIQFARHPPKYRGIHFTSVRSSDARLANRDWRPAGEGRDRAGLSSRYEDWVLQPLLHSAQERWWVTANLGPANLESGPAQAPVQDVNAKTHSRVPFLQFAFEGRAYQYKVLLFRLSLSPRVFTKVAEAAIVPLRECGVRILNYLNDWLILAQSRTSCVNTGTWCSDTSACWDFGSTGKRANSPRCRGSLFSCGVGLGQSDSATHRGTCPVSAKLFEFIQRQDSGPTETFSEAPGAYGIRSRSNAAQVASYEAASALASQPSPEMGVAEWHAPGTHHPILSPNLWPMVGPFFSTGGSPSRSGVQAWCGVHGCLGQGLGGHVQRACSPGLWTGPQLQWHINCLELLAVRLALGRLKRLLHGKHVLVHTDNTATVAYINHQGGLRSRCMWQLARHLLLWSQKHLRSLWAIHIPGVLNRAADELSRQPVLPGEWRLHPQVVQLIWDFFGATQVDLFASPDSTHCHEPSSTDTVQSQGAKGAGPVSCAILAQPDLVFGTYAPHDSPSLVHSCEEGSAFSETGHSLAPASRSLETSCLVPGRDAEVLSGLPQEVVDTITSARAPSTRLLYALKWNLFVNWCSSHREDPRRCPIRIVLSFLQDRLEQRLPPSTLKGNVAAIAAHHDAVDGKSLGKHDLVVRFLRGARRLNPPRPTSIPSWDLSLVLMALQRHPFEPLQSGELKILSLKTVLLSALASIKRVGDLQAFSVDESCLEFGPANSHIVLRPRPEYVPKVPTTPFRDQVVSLQALPSEEADPALAFLCAVRALRLYMDRTQSFRTSDQLFVCFGGQQKGKAVSKQRLAHWIVDAIVLAYQFQDMPCPFGLRAHSTRSVVSSWALAQGTSLTDICRAAGWATPNTFARFYSLRVEPVSSRVLAPSGQ
ncbi:ORF V: Enzymatic polyprotein [Labeo rohita]|uniref:ORF V: Enzymatic polyprotein n=1 Tax=Labeo rohita TaxID=84645 RepID=A0ABQ8L334_LABRO|nr:ORF V: Enzymatic polyprotein [Labeo rohita]